MIPYTLTTLTLSAGTYLLMMLNIIGRPVANIPWTIPPIFSHYFVTGGNIPAYTLVNHCWCYLLPIL